MGARQSSIDSICELKIRNKCLVDIIIELQTNNNDLRDIMKKWKISENVIENCEKIQTLVKTRGIINTMASTN